MLRDIPFGHSYSKETIATLEESIFIKEEEKRKIDLEIKKLKMEIDDELLNYYTAFQASDRMEVSVNTIIKKINSNRYSGVHVGGKWYVSKTNIDDELYAKKRKEQVI